MHESGDRTLTGTILNPIQFLREVPIAVAMVLFVFAAYGPPTRSVEPQRAKAAPVRYRGAFAGALLLVSTVFAIAASTHGPAAALNSLFQYTTRAGDTPVFGSHWQHHWLSTLWFGIATVLAARLGALVFGGPLPAARAARRPFERAAWLYFVLLTVVFGVSSLVATDPIRIGSQAREIATHGLITLPLALAMFAWLERRRGVVRAGGDAADAVHVAWYHVAFAIAIPMYLGVIVKASTVIEAGQTGGGLVAMAGAHFFEHALDYVFVALLIVGVYGHVQHSRSNP